MKKAVSILLIIALLFSFAACSKKVNGENLTTTETTVPPPVIEKQSHSKKFKNDDGKTVFTVDVEVPQITGNCDESVMKYINTLSLEMFDDACDFAESNLQNAEKFMASSGSDSPWSKKITVETTYADSRFVCFLMKEYFSIGGDAGEPVWSSRCFDIKREQVCTLFDFMVDTDNPASGYEILLNDILIPAVRKDFEDTATAIDETAYERFDQIFSSESFYLTEKGFVIFTPKNRLNPSLSGTYSHEFSWREVDFCISMPEE